MKFKHRFLETNNTDSEYNFKEGNINLKINFFENMLRVAIYKDASRIFPTFSVCPDGNMPKEGRNKLSIEGLKSICPNVEKHDDFILFKYRDFSLKLNYFNCEMSYFKNDNLLFKDREYIAYNLENEFGEGSRHYVSREENELIFGLGDKTGDINKNKRSFKLNTSDSMGFDARSSDPLYKHVPFYICKNSIGSYGIYYDTYSTGEFDFGREINNYYSPFKSFKCEEESLVFYVFFGEIEDIIINFKKLQGKDFLPPIWTLKYCGSTMAYTDAPNANEQLLNYIDRCKKMNIHPGGFYLSSGYTQIGDKRCVFNWNLDKIPDPKALADKFRENGIEFLPNVKPCFLIEHPLYDFIAKKGWFLFDSNGNPCIFPFWSGYGSYLDFTNPEAYEFWTKCVKENLVDLGYNNTWNDNNEYDIIHDDCYAYGFGNKIKAKLIKPLFSYLMSQASIDAQRVDIRKNAVSRSEIVGASRITSTWTGDNRTSFEDFRYNHKMAMTLSLSTINNFGQDIGGFAGTKPSKELFMRWIQYGIFTPRFVLHSWNDDGSSNMPWLYEDKIPQVKKLFELREKLIPYLYNQIIVSRNEYRPIIYPLFLKHSDYDIESDGYYFGDNIIACPIFDEGKNDIIVSLPDNNGNWYINNKMVKGRILVKYTIDEVPTYIIKGGSVIPYKEENDIVFYIYPLEEGTFEFKYYLDDGVSNVKEDMAYVNIKVKCDKSKIDVTFSDKTRYKYKIIDGYKR